MTWKNSVQVLASSLLLTVALASGPARAANPVKDVRLYAIECGRIDVKDLGAFADTGEYDGQSGTLTVSCYLIRHPKGRCSGTPASATSWLRTRPASTSAASSSPSQGR